MKKHTSDSVKDVFARMRLTMVEQALGYHAIEICMAGSFPNLFNRVAALELKIKQLECPHKRVRECTEPAPSGSLIATVSTATCLDCDKQLDREFMANKEQK